MRIFCLHIISSSIKSSHLTATERDTFRLLLNGPLTVLVTHMRISLRGENPNDGVPRSNVSVGLKC